MSDWIAPLPGVVDGPLVGESRPMLAGYLAWQRSVLMNICAGLDGDELACRPLVSSTLSLLGLVRHLSKVERIWFVIRAAQLDVPMLYPLGRDDDFDLGTAASAEHDFAVYAAECAAADAAVAGLPDDHLVDTAGGMSLRMIYVHMIGEYARHNGHADLLRQAIDGVTGR